MDLCEIWDDFFLKSEYFLNNFESKENFTIKNKNVYTSAVIVTYMNDIAYFNFFLELKKYLINSTTCVIYVCGIISVYGNRNKL